MAAGFVWTWRATEVTGCGSGVLRTVSGAVETDEGTCIALIRCVGEETFSCLISSRIDWSSVEKACVKPAKHRKIIETARGIIGPRRRFSLQALEVVLIAAGPQVQADNSARTLSANTEDQALHSSALPVR